MNICKVQHLSYRIFHEVCGPEVGVVLDQSELEKSWNLETSGEKSDGHHELVGRLSMTGKFTIEGAVRFFFYLPDPSTMQNLAFKGRRKVLPGETINITSSSYFGAFRGVNSQLWVMNPLP